MSHGTPIAPPARAREAKTPRHADGAWIWPSSTATDDRALLTVMAQRLGAARTPALARPRTAEDRPDGSIRLSWDVPIGQTLAEVRATDRLAEASVLRAMVALITSLAEARAAGVCVGCWDPANLQVADDETLRLIVVDPGVRGLATGLRPRPSTITEASATAPERATGAAAGPASVAAESYAVGATLVYALTGSPALNALTPEGYLRAQLSGDLPKLTSLDSHLTDHSVLADFIADCLQRAPDSRPQTYEELQNRLQLAVREAEGLDEARAFLPARVSDTVEMRRPRAAQSEDAPVRRRWRAVLVPVGVLAVLVAIFATLVANHPRARIEPPERPPAATADQVPTTP